MKLILLILVLLAPSGAVCAIRLPDGQPLAGVYYFTHWWEPWKSSDERILQDLRRLKSLGFNTIFLDHEWSQMIAGDWKLLDRGHRLAREAGMQILPWLSAKVWLDIGTDPGRRERVKQMYGVELTMGVDDAGKPGRTKPYDPAVIEAGTRYCLDYLERYAKDGALLRVVRDGKPRPVIAPAVELEWSGSCDAATQVMFRLWLRARYGSVERLNRIWGTKLERLDDVDICDKGLFDLEAHAAGRARYPRAVEDHIEFRAHVIDESLAEISRRVRLKYPDVLIATELPYQFESSHPHAIGYRVSGGANPSAALHADILVVRATDWLTPPEQKALRDHRKKTGQQVVLAYRTYDQWGRALLAGQRKRKDMAELYGGQAGALADGFGLYSWNEMVDTHIVPDPDPPLHPTSRITAAESEALIGCIGEMVKAFRDAKPASGR